MAKISISLPDELVNYLNQKVEDKSIFIASILQQWRQQQEAEELAQAFLAVDELESKHLNSLKNLLKTH